MQLVLFNKRAVAGSSWLSRSASCSPKNLGGARFLRLKGFSGLQGRMRQEERGVVHGATEIRLLRGSLFQKTVSRTCLSGTACNTAAVAHCHLPGGSGNMEAESCAL